MQTKKGQTAALSEVQTQRAFWLSIGTGVLMLITLVVLLLTSGDRPWNGLVDIRVFVAIIVLCGFVSAWLTRQGKAILGISLILGAFYIIVFWACLYIQDMGVAVAAVTLTLTFGITSAVMPSTRMARYATITAAIVAAAVILLDLFRPFKRAINDSPEITWVLTIFLVLVYGFLILRQYNTYALRTKLLIAFISVTVIATGILSAFVIITTTNNLRKNLERELSAVSVSHATQVGNLFSEQINNLTTLSVNETLQQAVIEQNQSYDGNAAAIKAEIDAKDAQWQNADAAGNNADPLVREHLSNPAALDLIEYQKNFPDNAEIFITDIHGGLVGATNRTSDYNQADEAWWQVAYNNNKGAVYIGSPEFDKSAGNLGIQIALPLRNRDTGKIIGILRTTYIMTPLAAILKQDVGETSSADIFIPAQADSHIHEGLLEPIDPQIFKQLQAVAGQGMAEINYEGDLSVVTQARIKSRDGNPAIDNLGWVVVFHQNRDIAYAPVNAQIQGIIIVVMVVILFATIAAVFLAQFLVQPLTQLTNTAQEIAGGNFDRQAQVTSSDEIGLLASAFNNMTQQLRDFIGTLENRVADRTAKMERRNLDLALATEIGQTVSQVREINSMLSDAAEIIRTFFGLYYVQVYLVNPAETELVLQFGTGSVGKELVSRGHRLPLNENSINGRAAVTKRSVIIPDTTASATFRPNPLLPNTRSEIAVPLLVGDKLIGVLDVQSEKVGMLNEDALLAFEPMSGQMAIAIQNSRLVAETQQARAEVETLARRLTRSGWEDYLDAVHQPEHIGYMFANDQITTLRDAQQSELAADKNTLAAPIAVIGEKFGALVVEMDEAKQNAQTIELVNTVARQVSQQIESLRLLESTERYRAEAEKASRRITLEGWKEYTDANTSKGLSFIYDLKEVRPLDPNMDLQAETSAHSVPLKVNNETIGKLVVQGLSDDDSESLDLANMVAERLSAHIENLRLSEQSTERAQRERALRQITSAVRGSTDPATILRSAARELGTLLGRKTIVRLATTARQPSQAQPPTDLVGEAIANNGNKPVSPAELPNADGGEK